MTENSELVEDYSFLKPAAKSMAQESRLQHCQTHGDYGSLKILGRWTECPKCAALQIDEISKRLTEEARQRKVTVALAAAKFPDRFSGATFTNWTTNGEGKAEVRERAMQFAGRPFEAIRLGRSLLMVGKVGTGKTHLAVAIGKSFIEFGYSVRYTTVASMIREIRGSWGGAGDEGEVFAQFTKPDLLILDEVGMQQFTDSERTLIGEVIDLRYQGIKTQILISNLPVTDDAGPSIEQAIGSRALDRLRENGGKQIIFDWESHRG